MKVLVAGGAGFVGSNLVHRLKARGDAVTVVDNFLTGAERNLPAGVTAQRVDCASPDYRDSFATGEWDLVFHLAGASSAPLFDEKPLYAAQAIAGFQNSLEIARECGAKVAFASTSSFYARCKKPFREDMPVTAGTLYEFSKLGMEHLANAYSMRYGVESVALRFFSVYGPREEAKGRLANVLSQFLWDMRAGKSPVVYGDGSQTRDFTHVDDILAGMLLALDKSKGFQVFNIGTEVEHTFNEVIAMLNKALGTDIEPKYVANPVKNYVSETLADTTRLRKLGWKPTIGLKQGIRGLATTPVQVSAKTGPAGVKPMQAAAPAKRKSVKATAPKGKR